MKVSCVGAECSQGNQVLESRIIIPGLPAKVSHLTKHGDCDRAEECDCYHLGGKYLRETVDRLSSVLPGEKMMNR